MDNQKKISIPLIALVGIVLALILTTFLVIKTIQNISSNKNIDISKNDVPLVIDENNDDDLVESNNLIDEQLTENEEDKKEESIDENAKDKSKDSTSIATSKTNTKVSSVANNKNNSSTNSNNNSSTNTNDNVVQNDNKPDVVPDNKPQEDKNEKILYDLYSKVGIGDYVDYPVSYSNVSINGKKANLIGWRVLSKSNGTVNLISAGVPESIYLQGISGTSGNVFNSKINKYINVNFATSVHILTIEELKQFVGNINLDKKHSVPTYTPISHSNKYYNLIVTPVGYWLYNMINDAGSKYRFYIHQNGIINNIYMGFEDSSSSYNATYGIRPIVTLKYGLKTTGKNDSGVWNITL